MSKHEMPTSSLNDFYDQRYAGDYMDTDAYTLWGHGDLQIRQVLDTLDHTPKHPDQILDYGCGVGSWVDLLSHVYPKAKISGVDVSSTAIEKAQIRYPECRFNSFDGMQAPFQDESFDFVFSYHVLEHVVNFDASIQEIARMLKSGGHAVIIFPCGNEGSFLDRTMRLIENAWQLAEDGRKVFAFETLDGHVRRVSSQETIDIFGKNGLDIVAQHFSGHFFGTVDWLCRGTGPAYINRVFSGKPTGALAKIRLDLTRRTFLSIHRFIQKKELDTEKKRNAVKQLAVITVKKLAAFVDRIITRLSALEWRYFKSRQSGTAQYLVFQKVRTPIVEE